ncbi:MAG: HlyD family efflux transporter periplasmic adaptor subunit [Eubacteriales bacterium]|nr:HlyD family efflux transporter periplasmic adaptor subunit [Eubacteriales bacterium]
MYQMTPPQPPKPPKKKLNILQLLILLAAFGFAIWYLVKTLAPAASPYATITAGTLGARYSGDCLIVRNETPFDAEGVTSVDYKAEEGSLVQRGDTICNVYSSSLSTKEVTALQDYRDQIRDYQLQLLSAETTYDAKMARVESDVLSRAREVREMIAGARGSLINQEKLLDAAIDARQQYLKQKYSSDQRLTRLYDDELSQEQRIQSWTKAYAATQEGLVSFYSDGYEYSLTAANYDTFIPSDVRRMYNGYKPEKSTTDKGKTTIYRTVRDGMWYVLFLSDDSTWTPVDGQTYELKLERFENTTVMATVESSTRSGGELLVRLSVSGSVKPVLYMRTCQAELGDYVSSLCVPSRALIRKDDMDCVVVVDGANQSLIPVNILLRDGDNVYITAIQQGLLYEGQTVLLF